MGLLSKAYRPTTNMLTGICHLNIAMVLLATAIEQCPLQKSALEFH